MTSTFALLASIAFGGWQWDDAAGVAPRPGQDSRPAWEWSDASGVRGRQSVAVAMAPAEPVRAPAPTAMREAPPAEEAPQFRTPAPAKAKAFPTDPGACPCVCGLCNCRPPATPALPSPMPEPAPAPTYVYPPALPPLQVQPQQVIFYAPAQACGPYGCPSPGYSGYQSGGGSCQPSGRRGLFGLIRGRGCQ